MSYMTVIIKANENEDNCLTAAANTYIEDHPELVGWDLSPRWTDSDRTSVALTVPVFPQVRRRVLWDID
jgi:hypothetical protein